MADFNTMMKKINKSFKQIESRNLTLYQKSFVTFSSSNKDWLYKGRPGSSEKISSLPSNIFMTTEICSLKNDHYNLSFYTCGPHAIQEKAFLIHSDIDETIPHRHDYFEIIYVENGYQTMLIEGEKVRLNAGDFCIFDMQTAHLDIRKESQGTAFYIGITGKVTDPYFYNSLNSSISKNFFLKGVPKGNFGYLLLKISKNKRELFKDSLSLLFKELDLAYEGYEKICQTTCIRLINACSNPLSENIHSFDKKILGDKMFNSISKFINHNISNISIPLLVDEFHYQADYYNRLIKKKHKFDILGICTSNENG